MEGRMNPEKENRPVRPTRGIGWRVLLQSLLFILIVVAVNVLSFRYYERFDWSRSDSFRLATQTQQLLRSLRGDVLITVFYSPTQLSVESLLSRDIDGFMREIVFSGKPKVRVEYVDPTRQIQRAREVAARLGFSPEESVFAVEYDGRSQVVPLADMGEFDFTAAAGGGPPRVTAFRGEQVLASMLLALLDPGERKIYFLQGHGEPALDDDSPVSLFLQYVRRQNAGLAPLNLATLEAVPDDAAAVVIIGPRYDISEKEMRILLDFWEKQEGRFLLFLNPDARTPNLHKLAAAAGIEVRDDRVLRIVPLNFAIGIVRDVSGTFTSSSDIVKRLQGVNAYLPDPVQSLAVLDPAPERVQARPLLLADEAYWGETDYVTDESKGVAYDDGVDTGYPVILAMSSDRSGLQDDRLEIPAAKMLVVGNAGFLRNDFLAGPGGQAANLDFALSGLNWLLDRHRLTGVVPKTPVEFTLTLGPEQLGTIALYTMIVIPGAVAVLGLLVWWRRRV